jgi:hypothetical protein
MHCGIVLSVAMFSMLFHRYQQLVLVLHLTNAKIHLRKPKRK